LRIVFAGTPEFAVPCLRACARHGEVVAAYTQPDRPAGRGRGLQPSPVKLEAVQRGIPVHQPENFRSAASKAELRALQPDLMVVVAYGLLLPQSVLDIPVHGCWNVHASLLPRWRGAAPIQRAIEAGDAQTGITIMQMDVGLDTGAMLLAEPLPIGPQDSAAVLHDRLAALGARLIVRALTDLPAGRLTPIPQPEAGVTYAHKILKSESMIDWRAPAGRVADRVRAFDPFPGCVGLLRADGPRAAAEPLKIWRAHAVASTEAMSAGGPPTTGRAGGDTPAPGELVRPRPDRLLVRCGDGWLELLEVQRPGGRRLPVPDWLRSAAPAPDACFDVPTDPVPPAPGGGLPS